tara:strand:+ start:8129 stop:9670 length:1542 start_codon:yes stop_codon:yes gene_type:complete
MNKIKRALISVWDKTGILELAEFLVENNIKIYSTGGTKNILEKHNIDVISISHLTKQNEIMNGRVKTLHPRIFGGILADRNNEKHILDLASLSTELIDLVIVNLYPFKSEAVDKKLDFSKAIEFIDIGGPSMLRAAAKNHENVIPLCDSSQYEGFIELFKNNKGLFSSKDRISFAREVFKLTFDYDYQIYSYFRKSDNEKKSLNLFKVNTLRYGENPHQKSSFYLQEGQNQYFDKLHGKDLSYNNYFDIETAVSIVSEFDDLSCVIIKHANPCGFAVSKSAKKAYNLAVSCDPISYFGGIVAFNSEVGLDVAVEMNKSFLECIVAPDFTSDALSELKKKKNLRLIKLNKSIVSDDKSVSNKVIKSVFNGFLIQDKDNVEDNVENFEVVSKKQPNKNELKALYLSWKLVKYVKSNAIVFSNDTSILGIGAGQMSRIDSAKIAINKARENNLELKGSVMASDAFFPFSDCVKIAADQGVVGVIQPGGSIKDEEVIEEVNKRGMFMIFTKTRHFYH